MVRRRSNTGYKTRDSKRKQKPPRSGTENSDAHQNASVIRIVNDVQERIVRGTFHQGDARFSSQSRGRQCTANAAIAIVMRHVVELPDWTADTIDAILVHGDALYIDSVSKRKVPDGNEPNHEFLRVTELNQIVQLGDMHFKFVIDESSCIDGNLVHSIEGFPNLRSGLDLFFSENPCGILTTKGISIALIRTAEYYWLFDSHARGPYGRSTAINGAACLMRFTDTNSLYDVLSSNLNIESSSSAECQYSMMPIYLINAGPTTEKKVRSDAEKITCDNDDPQSRKEANTDAIQKVQMVNSGVGKSTRRKQRDTALERKSNKVIKTDDTGHSDRETQATNRNVGISGKRKQHSDGLSETEKRVKTKELEQTIVCDIDEIPTILPQGEVLGECTQSEATIDNSVMNLGKYGNDDPQSRKEANTDAIQKVQMVNSGVGKSTKRKQRDTALERKSNKVIKTDDTGHSDRETQATNRNVGISGKRKQHSDGLSETEKRVKTKELEQTIVCDTDEISTILPQGEVLGECTPSEATIDNSVMNLGKYDKEFKTAIWNFADNTCTCCNRTFYKIQMCRLGINDICRSVLPAELNAETNLSLCKRCAGIIKRGKCPAQAYWNEMFLDPVPDVIAILTSMEKRLLCMVTPFMKIIKLGGQYGQYGFKGQAVLFAADVEEVIEQLPLSITSAGVAIICEKLENVVETREFQVDVEKLWSALVWLKENNPLYQNVQINYTRVNYDVSQICQVVENIESPREAPPNIDSHISGGEMKNIKYSRGILRASFHQGDQHFSEASRNNQGTANAAIAIVMSTIIPLSAWSKDTIDTVLINGDRFYTESKLTRPTLNVNGANLDHLTVTELHRNPVVLENTYKLRFDDSETVYGPLRRDKTKEGFPNLTNSLPKFLSKHPAGILIANTVSVAVFKFNNYTWLFDSHARGPNGRKAGKKGTACLMRFESSASLSKLLMCNLPKLGANMYNDQYSLSPVYVDKQSNGQEYLAISGKEPSITRTGQLEGKSSSPAAEVASCNLPMMTSVLRPIDECVPQLHSVIDTSVLNTDETDVAIPLRTLRRKTAPPLQMNVERRAEELAWFYLFPKGRNGIHEPNRKISITALDYCQARVMSSDKRFHRNDYLFYALSVMEYHRARQNVGVCLRLRQGGVQPEGLVNNLFVNMRAMRGSNAYWQSACSDLIAMVRNVGPPTWFVTFSCNDLNWLDMLTACLKAAGRHEENPADLRWEDKMKLIEESPVTLARQFMVRLHAILRILKNDDEILGGRLVDYWWRIEFQNRGSPHLHMLCWNRGIPSFESPEGIGMIDKVVSCTSKPPNDELAAIVKKVQVHRHTQSCYKNRRIRECRFGFPRQVSDSTKVLDSETIVRNKGRFCILKRGATDIMINNYNPSLLKLWNGNMDIQPCGNVTAIAYYIAKYAAKNEPQDVGQAVKDAITKTKQFGGDIGRQLFAVSMAILRFRQVSAPECAFRLCHLKLKEGSRKVVFVNTCPPQERYRMLKGNTNEGQVYMNIFDRYINRPDYLDQLSLAEFAVSYEHMTTLNNDEDSGDNEVYDVNETASEKIIYLQNGMRMKKRTRRAILKTRTYNQRKARENYFYSYLVAHIPFRNEQDLVEDFESAEAAFNAQHHLLRPLQETGTIEEFLYVERELRHVIQQVLALQEPESHGAGAEKQDDQAVRDKHFEAIVDGYEPGLLDLAVENDDDKREVEPVLTSQQFLQCVRTMNVEQRELYKKITDAIQEDLSRCPSEIQGLKLFITGGAGCGKTFLLKMIVHQIRICYAPTVDSLLNATFVEVCALTGVAARLIHGRTLHHAFSLAIEKGKASVYRQLSGQRLEDLRRRWRYIRWLIVDEISMVSYENLRSVHLRLQELKNNTLLFGGVHVLLFGDIMQLPPVKGNWCFNQPWKYAAEPHIWRFFGLCELQANMRQQNDAPFVDLLNNLRVGQLTMEQYEMLLSRTRVPLENEFADGEAVRIFPTLKLVEKYNDRIMEQLATRERIYTINARDESREAQTYGQRPPDNAIPNDTNNTGGFLNTIKLGIGCRVMLRTNIRVSEGLVNGAMGIVKGFIWEALRRDQLENGELPKKVLIEFDSPLVGSSFKEANGFVGIAPVSVTYQANKGFGNVERTMVPLILSWAVTVHKLQGTTVDKAVVYLGKKVFAKGQAYVALSRIRSLEGIVICDLDRGKLFNNPHDIAASMELDRLRNLSENTEAFG